MDANDNSKKLYLDARDGLYTEAGPMADGRIHITEVQVDDGVYLTREQIAELAEKFPLPSRPLAGVLVSDAPERETLRDRFAVAALSWEKLEYLLHAGGERNALDVALAAYRLADAMLEARKRV